MVEPILRAVDVEGELYNDPSEDALYMLMEEIRAPGASIRVERLEEGRKDEWAAVKLRETGLYEFESDQHVRYVGSMRSVHELLTRWAFDLTC